MFLDENKKQNNVQLLHKEKVDNRFLKVRWGTRKWKELIRACRKFLNVTHGDLVK